MGDDGHPPCAERLRRFDQDGLNKPDTGQEIVQHRKEHGHDDDKRHRALAKTEPQNCEWDPRQAGNSLQQIYERIEKLAAGTIKSHQVTQWDRRDSADKKSPAETDHTGA